jgi:hypothetical protein
MVRRVAGSESIFVDLQLRLPAKQLLIRKMDRCSSGIVRSSLKNAVRLRPSPACMSIPCLLHFTCLQDQTRSTMRAMLGHLHRKVGLR